MILEIVEQGSLIRFMGTSLVEIWGSDPTNTIFNARLPKSARRSMAANVSAIVGQPCGMFDVAVRR